MAQVKRQDQQQRTTLDTFLETGNSEGSWFGRADKGAEHAPLV